MEPLIPIASEIWNRKYRLKAPDGTPIDLTVDDTWRRVAEAAALAEPAERRAEWAGRFHEAMAGFAFLPAGRILAGAGAGRAVTLFNCFVMGTIADDLGAIFENVREAALTMQQGGGIGHDFSTLRPSGALVSSIGADASGPVSFMDVWDAMCRTIMSAGSRRGAMMATLRCDHPDIELFVAAKQEAARLRNFNLSVLVTDAFVAAVEADADWPLVFAGKVYRTVKARELWQQIMRATYDYAEPGVIFIDRVNARNNLAYCETIAATNPCGEQPLPPHGACLLGSIDLARLVVDPFGDRAALDEERLDGLVRTAVRFLDDVIDVSRYPLPSQEAEARSKRRIGLGLTGLADALAMLRMRYGSAESLEAAERWMARIARTAYLASAEIAAEKGPFPLYDRKAFLKAPGVAALPADVRRAISRHGIRNGLLTSIAPTGTISLFAGNVSSGVEPIFDYAYRRRILEADGSTREEMVEDYAYRLWRRKFGAAAPLPDYFVRAGDLAPADHLAMQAALQRHVDSSISKTINCPADIPFESFASIYLEAYRLGLKGCTTFRPNPVTGSVLTAGAAASTGPVADSGTAAGPGSETTVAAASAVRPRDGAGLSTAHAAGEAGRPPVLADQSRPIAREPVLEGFTYKLRWPDSDHAIYVTINDIAHEGQRRPFEIFINSKNLEHYAWTVALTRMISAVFRRGGDVGFVVEELKAVFDPRGGQWLGGHYVPSLLAAIGEIIEQHMIRTGFLSPGETADRLPEIVAPVAPAEGRPARFCPRCQQPSYVFSEGCWVCHSCGYSKCS
ncbi:MAG: adenosylcobalamin-dependent ribonucleoside-diphosphate reductase [Hyphomicrobiaceae bacterium]